MSEVDQHLAGLVERKILDLFASMDGAPMVRVEALGRSEVIALVERLRAWTHDRSDVRVSVTVDERWPELSDAEMVSPRFGKPATHLRNLRDVGVVLIEGDDFSDKQSWRNVTPISDATLLATEDDRQHLVRSVLGRDAPVVLFESLEDTYRAVRAESDSSISVRRWIRFVRNACVGAGDGSVLSSGDVWDAIARSLPLVGLFPDGRLDELTPTDRARALKRNVAESERLRTNADESWRDRLRSRLSDVTFVGTDGSALKQQGEVRDSLESLLDATRHEEPEPVELSLWLQLVDAKSKRSGLGTRIREKLEAAAPERVQDYDDLGVTEGIDAGLATDAQKLLDASNDDEAVPLPTLLDRKTNAALERMANPRAPKTTTPLSALVATIHDMVKERQAADDAEVLPVLRIRQWKDSEETRHSRALFAWLFGTTLASVSSALPDSLVVDESLLDSALLSEFLGAVERRRAEVSSEEDDDQEEESGAFGPLQIVVEWCDGEGRAERIEWSPDDTPGLVMLWRLAAISGVERWTLPENVRFESWLGSALLVAPVSGDAQLQEPEESVLSDWNAERKAFLRATAEHGLAVESIAAYVDVFVEALRTLRVENVPTGAADPVVRRFLRMDVLEIPDQGGVLLAVHPARLRWIGAYLERMRDLLQKALTGDLLTNPVNRARFLDELDDLSPQAQPPISIFEERLCLAVREKDWHEVYAPLRDRQRERRDWLADLDDGAIDEVADKVIRYIDAYPHKADGLHLLYMVRPGGARSLERIVSRVTKALSENGAVLRLSLCVAPDELRDVDDVLQQFDDLDHRAVSDSPPLRVAISRWENPGEELPDLTDIDDTVDVAVVPNLFGASTTTHDATLRGGSERTFQPLYDEPARLVPVGTGKTRSSAVSRVLLPSGDDELLATWSTLVTRQFRGGPVGDDPELDADHVTIRVSLDENRDFFTKLHEKSHWVVTVDGFVGREQIDALSDGPDVLRVQTGVGANGAYRLVVSSAAGRRFIEDRIAGRLVDQLGSDLVKGPAELANRIYDAARLLVPGIVLRSIGMGRSAAEMVGLVLARRRVEEKDPARVTPHGFQSWLSLDEHPEWSGGAKGLRADLARIRGWMNGRTLHLCVDVVEAKMRSNFSVTRAERQIARSVELLSAVFGAEENVEYVDAPMWRRLVVRAIEQSSIAPDATPAATHVANQHEPMAVLDDAIRDALLSGDVVLERSIGGILLSIADEDIPSDTETPTERFTWLQLNRDEVRDTLTRLSEEHRYPLLPRSSGTSGRPASPTQSAGRDDAAPDTLKAPNGVNDARSNAFPASKGGSARGGRTRSALDKLQSLVDALYRRGIEVSPEESEEDALEGPGFFRFRVRIGRGHRPKDVVALQTDLQYQLELEAGQLPRIFVDRGAVVVEVPKRESERYYVAANDLWARTDWPEGELYAPLGEDVRGESIGVNFSSSRSPHLLIGGMTGGGKSVALETLLLGLVKHYSADRLELRIVDPKGNEFTQFEEFPHVRELPGMDAEDAIELLEQTAEEMDARYRAMKNLSRERKVRIRDIQNYNETVGPKEAFRWVVIVLDEFADLTADKEHKKTIEALLQRIAQKARACGIHAIVATQKPSAEVISTTTRSNLGAQLALRVRSGTDSRVIMEATGAESLAGNGDAFLRLSGEEPIRLQCAKA